MNTNEVGRSAVIGRPSPRSRYASAARSPSRCGLQRGLNLLCDRYRLDYGPAGATGPADAPVQIRCDVVGGSPIAATLPTISARVGLDRLRSTCATQISRDGSSRPARHRATRVDQAGSRRSSARISTIVQGDAVERVGDLVDQLPSDATAVVTSTWAVAYFSAEQRIGFRNALAAASAARPVAWISAENPGVIDLIPNDGAPSDPNGFEWSVLGLVVFRGGEADAELLGRPPPRQPARLAGVTVSAAPSPTVDTRPRWRGVIHRWAVPVSVVLFAILGSGPRVSGTSSRCSCTAPE